MHGFVLAGGQSTRMGEDKALLRFRGRPLVQGAVETLRTFCAEVGIAGNRSDLGVYAGIVQEARVGVGPAAGVEAGLLAARLPWALFVPVDVPLMPPEVLRAWAEAVVFAEGEAVCASYLTWGEQPQPAFCLLRKACVGRWSASMDGGERRLLRLLRGLEAEGEGAVRAVEVEDVAHAAGDGHGAVELWFSNVNTPEDLAEAAAAGGPRERDPRERPA